MNIIALRLVPWWADSKLITQLVGEPEVWGREISGIEMNDAGPLEALNFRYSPHYILHRSGIHQIGWPQELLCLWKFVTSQFQLDHKHCKKNPFLLSVSWSFYFPSHLNTGSPKEWGNEQKNGKGNRTALNSQRDLLWIPQEVEAPTNLTQIHPAGPRPPNVISDLFFLEDKLSWIRDLLEHP